MSVQTADTGARLEQNAPGVRDVVLGTAGHIDHGKTALVRALTGVDTDRLPQEKQRGITIDIGFASLDLGDVKLAVVDVPGHERFIRNMLAGASAIDMALLVVAADDSVMPQTREHLEILKTLNVRAGVVALTKCDLADPTWLDLVEGEVRELVSGTFLETAPIVRTSAATGEGIDALKDTIARAARSVPAPADVGVFRMAIDRVFAVEGHGTVVTGTIASGSVAVADTVECWPAGIEARVRGLQRHDQKVERLGRGVRAAINLAGVHHTQLWRGCEVATPGFLKPTRRLTVELRSSPGALFPIKHRQRLALHLGTNETPARVLLLREGDTLAPGESCLAQLVLLRPVTAVYGEPFVVRAESPAATLGGGRVLEPAAQRIKRRDQPRVVGLLAAAQGEAPARLELALERAGLDGAPVLSLVRDTGLTREELAAARQTLEDAGRLVELTVAPRRVAKVPLSLVERLEQRVLRVLARRHRVNPRASVVPRGDLHGGLADLGSEVVVSALLDRLAASGAVVANGRALALAGFKPQLSQAERRLKASLAQAISGRGFSPPTVDELVAESKSARALVGDLLALLAAEGQIVEIGGGIWLDAASEAEMRQRVTQALQSAGESGLTMAELRDAMQTTRKYAVPIGEYLDRVGVTVRQGDRRLLAKDPGKPNADDGP